MAKKANAGRLLQEIIYIGKTTIIIIMKDLLVDVAPCASDAVKGNYSLHMIMLLKELRDDSSDILTLTALENALCDSLRQDEFSARWLALDVHERQKLKEAALSTFAFPRAGARVVSSIAAVEWPVGQWPELVGILSRLIRSNDTNSKIASLESINYLCKIKPDVVALRSRNILIAIMHGARENMLHAFYALFNFLEFVRFDQEEDRDCIIEVICKATVNVSVLVQICAFECLIKTMVLYYDEMPKYMSHIHQLTLAGMAHSDEGVALQAVKFWTTVCEKEIQLQAASNHFAMAALPTVIPVLLNFLTQDEQNLAMSAGTCLSYMILVALQVPDLAVVNQMLPQLISMINDDRLKVTAAWTLGQICDVVIPDDLDTLVMALTHGLLDEHIVHHCCLALMNLAGHKNIRLSSYSDSIVVALVWATQTPGPQSCAYEAITSCVLSSTLVTVDFTLARILSRMENLLDDEVCLSVDDWNELQSNLCSVIISVIRRAGRDIRPEANRIMTLIRRLFLREETSTALQDAFIVVGSLAEALEVEFAAYIEDFLPFLYLALRHNDPYLCMAAVGIISDISYALGDQSVQYAEAFMQSLIETVQNSVLSDVKKSIFSCFGDIALAIGPAFDPYSNEIMNVLSSHLGQDSLREGILETYWILQFASKTDR